MPANPPESAALVDDLLDVDQVALLLEILTAEDWRISLDSFAEAGREAVDSLIAQAKDGKPHHRQAHTLKGMALNLGAAALGHQARTLEKAPTDRVLAEADQLRALLERSVAALEATTRSA